MSSPPVPFIRRLEVRRFRGIETLDWCPGEGLNVLLGGGDVGKSTVLDAIALLLRPSGSAQVTDTDYWLRDTTPGFSIEGTFTLPESVGVSQLPRMAYPWEWDGAQACIPDSDDVEPRGEPVYVFRVRGTDEFEVFHEIVHPDGTTDYFQVGLRRRIGLVWLGGAEPDRDLRLVYGSALDRLLADTAIRARLAHEISKEEVEQILKDEGKKNLAELEVSFSGKALPTNLGLGLTGSPRVSLAALVGLTAAKRDARLPLAAWGSGTQRLAALAVANANQHGAPVVLIDEVEKGLEPYRQRQLAHGLRDGPSQGFLTTHSTSVVEACLPAALWHVSPTGSVGRIAGKAAEHARSDPEAFLSRFIVVAEGATEVGFLKELLSRCFGHDLGVLGVSVTDAGGNENALSLLESLASAGLQVGALVDNEGLMEGRWKAVQADLGDLVLQWPSGCIEQTLVPLFPLATLESLVAEGDLTGERRRTLRERLQTESKDWDALSATGADMHQLVLSAALGDVPEWLSDPGEMKRFKKHSQHWFKSIDGGRELLRKVLTLGVWPSLELLVWPFVVKLGDTLDLNPIASGDLPATGQ